MIDFNGRLVIIIGGGQVGLRKASVFCRAGADVRVISKDFAKGFKRLPAKLVKVRNFEDLGLLKHAFLVVAATNDHDLNSQIKRSCREAGVMCNSVDDEDSDVYLPSIIARGPLTICISTRGASPALSKRARIMIEEFIGPEWGKMAVLLAEARVMLKSSIAAQSSRKEVLSGILNDKAIWSQLRKGDIAGARRTITKRHLEGGK